MRFEKQTARDDGEEELRNRSMGNARSSQDKQGMAGRQDIHAEVDMVGSHMPVGSHTHKQEVAENGDDEASASGHVSGYDYSAS